MGSLKLRFCNFSKRIPISSPGFRILWRRDGCKIIVTPWHYTTIVMGPNLGGVPALCVHHVLFLRLANRNVLTFIPS